MTLLHRFTRTLALFLATVASRSSAAPPAAAPAAPSSAPSSPAPTDLVALRDGSLIRGIVIELIVGDHVSIDTIAGERKTFPMNLVSYAGPADGWSNAAKPTLARQGAEVSVRFETNTPENLVHAREATTLSSFGGLGVSATGGGLNLIPVFGAGSSATFRPLCAPPCEAVLPAGPHTFALTHANSPLLVDNATLTITKPSVVHAAFVSRRDVRMAGLWTAVGGLALSAIGVPLSFREVRSCTADRTTYPGVVVDRCSQTTYQADPAIVAPVVGTTAVSLLVALTLALVPDAATFTLSPISPAEPKPSDP